MKKHSLTGSRQPGYTIQRHPRIYNKPLSCQVGKHEFRTKFDQRGVPMLVCSKCGAGIGKGLYEKTWSKKDMERITKVGIRKKRTKKEIAMDALKRMEEDQDKRRKRMHRSIENIVKRRMSDLV